MIDDLYDALSFFNLNIDLFSPECAVSVGYWGKWILRLLIPEIFLGLAIFLWIMLFIADILVSALAPYISPLQYFLNPQRRIFDRTALTSRFIYAGVQFLDFAYSLFVLCGNLFVFQFCSYFRGVCQQADLGSI